MSKWAKVKVQQPEEKRTAPPVPITKQPPPPRKRKKYKTKWTDEEEEFLIKNYERLTRYALAWRLRRTKTAVNLKIQSFIESGRIPKGEKEQGSPIDAAIHEGNPRGEQRQPKWTPAEEQFLIDNFIKYNKAQLARRLNRTPDAVAARLTILKIQGRLGRRKNRGGGLCVR